MTVFSPLWGDLHNHNDVGYGVGSLERALRLARQRLDVWVFTAHAYWHDIPDDPGSPDVIKHEEGFARVRAEWPNVLRRLADASDGQSFLAIPAYEWHSSSCGDRHVVAPDPPAAFENDMTPVELSAYARRHGALLIPHHLAYPPGARGVNWDTVDDELSPIAEVFSEHGSSEVDDGEWPMDGHSMSPRSTVNTWVKGLERGLRLGAVASTDNHDGCPAAYNEGLAGIWAEGPTAEDVLAALRSRRCYGVTGDRIGLDWWFDDAPMGSVLPKRAVGGRTFRCRVQGWDAIDAVDLVRNGRVWRRWTPCVNTPVASSVVGGGHILRLRWGWGPMSGRDVFHWEGRLRVRGGAIDRVMPGFGSVLPGDGSDGEFEVHSDGSGGALHWTSRTSRSFAQVYDQLAISLVGAADTEVIAEVSCRREDGVELAQSVRTTLGALREASREVHMSPPPFTPTFQMLRAVTVGSCGAEIVESLDVEPENDEQDGAKWPLECFYVRVRQKNGQLAWSSPIWFQR